MKIGLILLASGLARRFGRNKLLANLGGRTVLEHTMDAYPPHLFAHTVVVSGHSEVLAIAEAHGYGTAYNDRAHEGISASIHIGMTQMEGMDGVLFGVCDQPWLRVESVEKVLVTFVAHGDRIVGLSWRGNRGNPCLFPKKFFPELSLLRGDVGGGALIRSNMEAFHPVEVGSAEELRDVDHPKDLRHSEA